MRYRRLLVLAVGTFAIGTDSFVIAGVLPQIAASLHVGVGSPQHDPRRRPAPINRGQRGGIGIWSRLSRPRRDVRPPPPVPWRRAEP
jgi:hypothetical protein